jgi:predicted small lipoprotein YifL
MHRMIRMTLALALCALVAACGNKGPLVKPGQEPPAQKTTPAK